MGQLNIGDFVEFRENEVTPVETGLISDDLETGEFVIDLTAGGEVIAFHTEITQVSAV